MSKLVKFNNDIMQTIIDNLDIFKYEYPEVKSKTWDDFKAKPNCKCRGDILKMLKEDMIKFNGIICKLLDKDIEVVFPSPLEKTIVKEFENIKEMEEYLRHLNDTGKIIRSATPAPNGTGGFILIVM